tara:strand:- start:175 stop:759 length:585 start_codon:yes stop_codon:yes gene_type:complete
MLTSYPQELLQKKCQLIVRDTLKEKYVNLFVRNFTLREGEKTSISCSVAFSNEWDDIFIEGTGEGAVDALFTTMVSAFSEQYRSLSQVGFDDFVMQVKFKTNVRKTASPVEIKMALKNAQGKDIYFSSESNSMVKATISVVVSACEYLINAERAIVQLREDIKGARKRRRNDLIEAYMNQMVDLVSITSYEEIS